MAEVGRGRFRLNQSQALGLLWAGGLVVLGLVIACGPKPAAVPVVPMPSSPWGGNYSYSYAPPSAAARAASVEASIAVVNPSYREVESALMDPIYMQVGKGFSTSMGVDMDKILISKGMTVKGPFASLDEITYSDKKGSALTLAPKVFVVTQIKYLGNFRNVQGQSGVWMERDFEMSTSGWVSFVMQEPLSGEKMWLKKVELDPVVQRGVEAYEAIPQYTTTRGLTVRTTLSGYSQGKLIYDGKVDGMADTLKQMYPIIMEKCWTFIDPEEVVALQEKGKEIRASKVY